MRQFTIPVIAVLLIIVGLYFFPLGEDVVFKAFLDYAHQDYWTARFYQYVVFGCVLILGYVLLRYSRGMMSQPMLLLCVFGIAVLGYLIIRG